MEPLARPHAGAFLQLARARYTQQLNDLLPTRKAWWSGDDGLLRAVVNESIGVQHRTRVMSVCAVIWHPGNLVNRSRRVELLLAHAADVNAADRYGVQAV